ncbi:serine hydrolase domain-containing protein [Allokutzneria albata]|uniref:CubicO group peptidase, beta-lactamase class C family n=1 Tax=Allokutzneria albata TaxID=211114 RepID=A0A1G9UMR5_ALLAB|nr:serine hydrolase domain-containing protein [Allokutzneria albata]SDM61208.1 CubicO group peptidase, beta-lactamase class C family [Allokutzneria albata]
MNVAQMSRRLGELVGSRGVPGAQFAALLNGRKSSAVFGTARQGSGTPLTEDAKVPVGSVTKTCTAAVALALATEEDLELDEPISEYLPELGRDAEFGRVTTRQLLSHTAGLPSDATDLGASSPRRHVVTACSTLTPVGAPGAGFSYSNIGYVVVGGVVESVTGMSWREAVDAVLSTPLGLRLRYVTDDAAGEVVTGHAVRSPRPARPVRQSLGALDAPAGAIAASALDLLAVGGVFLGSPDLIDEDLVLEARTPVAGAEPFGMADGWGLGVAVYGEWFGHDGTADGTSAHLRVHPASGTVIALTTNGSTGFHLWQEFAAEFGLGCPGAPPRAGRVPPPRDCLGDYLNGDLEYSVTEAGDGRLALAVDGDPYAELTPLDGLLFAMRDVDTGDTSQTGRFLTGPGGGIDRIQVGGRLARRRRALTHA